jgi:hypothetical protein
MIMFQNAVTLLKAIDPKVVDSLRMKYPRQEELFGTTRELGDDESTKPRPEEVTHRQAVMELLGASIRTERDQLEQLIFQIRQRMVLVARTRLFGAVVSTTSAALSAVFAYAGGGQQVAAMVSALIAMAGGLSAILADYFERAPSGVKIASAEEYGKLVEVRSSLERIMVRVARDNLFKLDDQEIETISKAVDEFAGEIIRLRFA